MTRRTTGRKSPRTRGASAGRGGGGRAFTTGQAAHYCYVTADTIVNWIHQGTLRAQRTAGGQYRIRLEDLRSFMVAHQMSTDLLDREWNVRPYCWEFHGQGRLNPICEACLAYRSGALNCFELAAMSPSAPRLQPSCEGCAYHRRYADTDASTSASANADEE